MVMLRMLVLVVQLLLGTSSAEVGVISLSETLSSHMVLQQTPAQAKLWGWGAPGTKIVLQENPQTIAVVDSTGRWSMLLKPHSHGLAFGSGNLTLTPSDGSEPTVLTDVHFGEVWLCTGQSNMGLTLSEVAPRVVAWSGDVSDGQAEIANASAYPMLRVVQQREVGKQAPTEHASTSSGWFVPKPENIGTFSAVCWMFGRRLQQHLDVPIGLIVVWSSGSAVETWSSAEALKSCDQTRATRMAPCQAASLIELASAKNVLLLDASDDTGDVRYIDEGDKNSTVYNSFTNKEYFQKSNSTVYNGMIAPWIGTAVKGAIWYQGESNVACSDVWPYTRGLNCAMNASNCADYYACQFPAMITDWRQRFTRQGSDDFTFLFVGLPPYVWNLPSSTYGGRDDASLPLLRLAQMAATNLNSTFMTSLVDHGYLFGSRGSIHPLDKTPVGKRLTLAARQHAYQENVISSGPIAKSARVVGSTILLEFEPSTMGTWGIQVRNSDSPHQKCPVGQNQISGNPQSSVPVSQCGNSATGFELSPDGHEWHAVQNITLSAGSHGLELSIPPAVATADCSRGHSQWRLRYLFADWPVPMIYGAQSFLGDNGELPTPPFEISVESSGRECTSSDVLVLWSLPWTMDSLSF